MKSQIKYLFITVIFFIIISFSFGFIIFSKLRANEFLFIHDQWLFLSLDQLLKQASTRIFDSGGQPFSIQFSSGILHYFFSYPMLKLGFSLKNIEIFQFIIIIFTSLLFSFLGFKKLYTYKSDKNEFLSFNDNLNIILITALYFLNPYIVLTINGGIFWSISFALSFSLIPLFIYYVDRFIDVDEIITITDCIVFGLITYFAASLLTLFLPLIICTVLYIISKWIINGKIVLNTGKFFLSILIFILLMLPFLSMLIFETFYNKTNSAQSNLVTSGGGNQQGGLLYMFFFYFSWPLYINWYPRNILTFSRFYINNFFPLVPLSLFIVISFFLIKLKKIKSQVSSLLLILLASLFLGKGAQKPLGEIFSYITNNFVLFSAIRSPDNKFAPLIIFSIATIFLFILRTKINKKFIYFYLISVVFIMSFPLLTGEAIFGRKESGVSGEFRTFINDDFKETLNTINNDKELANIIIYPPVQSVAFYQIDGNFYGGQDMLTKSINKPILYFDLNQQIANNLFTKLSVIYNKFDFRNINELNVRYVIIRKKLYFYNNAHPYDFVKFRSKLLKQVSAKKILDNYFLDVYKVDDKQFVPRIRIPNSNAKVIFTYVSPVKYKISITNLRNSEKLIFAESFNKYWNLFLDEENNFYFPLSDISYLFKKPLFANTHNTINDYMNSWLIDPDKIQKNSIIQDSNNINLILYYTPQSLFYLTLIFSFGVLTILIVFLFYKFIKTLYEIF